MADRPGPPDWISNRPEPPSYAPVVFEDGEGDDDRRPPRRGNASDAGLLRLLGLVVVLAVVIAALVLPASPISVLGGGGDDSAIRTEARGTTPEPPQGFVTLSRLYDIEIPDVLEGPWTMTVPLEGPADRSGGHPLAFYRYDGANWHRVAPVELVEDGLAVQGDVAVIPPNVAVLQRVAGGLSLAAVVDAGRAPGAEAVEHAELVAVAAAAVNRESGAADLLEDLGDLSAARDAGARRIYLGVGARTEEDAAAVLRDDEVLDVHVAGIVDRALVSDADGVHLDYRRVPDEFAARFTRLVRMLDERLEAEQLGLVVSVPASPSAGSGAYDWPELLELADALWLQGPLDGGVYFEQIEGTLAARRAEGVDLSRVMLALERASRERSSAGVRRLTQREALVLASAQRIDQEGPIAPGQRVRVSGANIDDAGGNSGLRWDSVSRSVSFSFADREGPHTVWIENRYSAAFRIDLAERFGLGGLVVLDAREDEELPDLWEPVVGYVERGGIELQRPYLPYLTACWRATGGEIEGFEGCWREAAADSSAVTWRAPEQAGVYDISLIVSEGTVFVGQRQALRVTPDAEERDGTDGLDDGTGDTANDGGDEAAAHEGADVTVAAGGGNQ